MSIGDIVTDRELFDPYEGRGIVRSINPIKVYFSWGDVTVIYNKKQAKEFLKIESQLTLF